jgi:nitrite reductase (NADH) small subunit
MPFLRTARKDEIPAGQIREFAVEGKSIALANVDGTFYAINNTCLHRGGPLGSGELKGKIVTCPWHGWQYDVTNGKLVMNPSIGEDCYQVEVRGDDIFVNIG